MYGILFKRDMKNLARLVVPLWMVAIIASVIGVLLPLQWLDIDIGFALLIVMLSGVPLVALIMTLYYYYQTTYGNEGYFTLTLPMKAKDIFKSKFFSGFIMNFLTTIIALVAFLIAVCFRYYRPGLWGEISTELKKGFSLVVESFGAPQVALFIFLGIVIFLLGAIVSFGYAYLTITLAQRFFTPKFILLGIVCAYVVLVLLVSIFEMASFYALPYLFVLDMDALTAHVEVLERSFRSFNALVGVNVSVATENPESYMQFPLVTYLTQIIHCIIIFTLTPYFLKNQTDLN